MFYTIYNCIDTMLIQTYPITGDLLLLTDEEILLSFIKGGIAYGILLCWLFYMDAEEGPLDKLIRLIREANEKEPEDDNDNDSFTSL